jgi:hypothetical protein
VRASTSEESTPRIIVIMKADSLERDYYFTHVVTSSVVGLAAQ